MGDPRSEGILIRPIVPADDAYIPAIHMAAGFKSESASSSVHPQVEALLDPGRDGGPTADLLFGGWIRGSLRCAAVALVAPGRSALVLVAPRTDQAVASAVLRAQVQAAREYPLNLLEVLAMPGDSDAAGSLLGAGYRRLTSLIYLRARPRRPACRSVASGLAWVSFTPERASLFERALALSYEQSHDCPELSALRTPADALAGHRASGVFDPSLWWVALRDGDPVGVILLARLAGARGLELVYMGASVGARGIGVGDALLERGFECALDQGVTSVTLAVDRRNGPARRLYERWGFVEVGVREAWITSPLRR